MVVLKFTCTRQGRRYRRCQSLAFESQGGFVEFIALPLGRRSRIVKYGNSEAYIFAEDNKVPRNN